MEKELNDKMALVQYLIQKKRKKLLKETKKEFDPSHGQGRILVALKEYEGISLRDLAYALDLAPSSMSEMLFKLEKKGYVTREVDENDKRAQVIKLTEMGKSVEQEAPLEEDEVFACLKPEEQEMLGNYLDCISESLKVQLGYDNEKMERKKSKVAGRGG